MTAPLAVVLGLAADAWIALGVVALAAAFLGRRVSRSFSRKSGSCACPSGGGACGSGTAAEDFRRAAARGASTASKRAAERAPERPTG